jgi:formylglycine-generating enzyme required for sulfatase activity
VNDTVAVFSRKQIARILLAGGLILTIGGYQFSSRSHAETNKTSAATKPGKVTVKVRGANGRDDERSFTPGEGKTESFQDCIDSACAVKGPEMVVVPAGSFMMGSPEDENEHESDESPQHRVTIKQPFAVGKFEVTFAEWDACVSEGGCKRKPKTDWGRGRQPVMNVSWDDITEEYLPWLRKKTGKEYRLLSEAEWEYAARAGTTTAYSTGESITKKQAQFSEGSWGSAGKTVEVGSFPANAFGLHDMHGNVGEWVEDCWNKNYNGAPPDGSARTIGDCSLRVFRSGAWSGGPGSLRAADRFWILPDDRFYFSGFRLARTF